MLCSYGCGKKAIKKMKSRSGDITWCCSKSTNACSAVKERKKEAYLAKYGKENPGQVDSLREKARDTMEEKYGDRNYNYTVGAGRDDIRKRAYETMMANINERGFTNASQIPKVKDKKKRTMLETWGVEFPLQHPEIKNRTKETNTKRYGGNAPTCSSVVMEKGIQTKIDRYGTNKLSNGSKSARKFIRGYIERNGYDLDQVAYNDEELGVYEWGYRIDGKWYLWDLVVFEKGFRGNKNHIIEILEYNGPFHYTDEEVLAKGNEPSTPWPKAKTIKESRECDIIKERFGLSLTSKYTIVWEKQLVE